MGTLGKFAWFFTSAIASAAPELRDPKTFHHIADKAERSKALFLEASRTMLHARCQNCHPAGDAPSQGNERRVHFPAVTRTADGMGGVGMRCNSCHQDRNQVYVRVPGAPRWHLAPKEQAWQGKTPREICEQLKDKSRNGGKTLAEIVEHSAHDKLVAWGFAPGHDRDAAPGPQLRFGALMAAWVETGAECPKEQEEK